MENEMKRELRNTVTVASSSGDHKSTVLCLLATLNGMFPRRPWFQQGASMLISRPVQCTSKCVFWAVRGDSSSMCVLITGCDGTACGNTLKLDEVCVLPDAETWHCSTAGCATWYCGVMIQVRHVSIELKAICIVTYSV